jgi:hypothetical protein
MELEFSGPIFEKYSYIKFLENPSSGRRLVPCRQTDERTDVTKLIVAFRYFRLNNEALSISAAALFTLCCCFVPHELFSDWWNNVPLVHSVECFILKMKALRSFETSAAIYQRTRHNIPEHSSVQQHRSENLWFRKRVTVSTWTCRFLGPSLSSPTPSFSRHGTLIFYFGLWPYKWDMTKGPIGMTVGGTWTIQHTVLQ